MKSYSIQTRFGMTAAALATLVMLDGCEGESRKRSAANSNLPDSSSARKADPPAPKATTNSAVASNNSSTSSEPTTNSSDPSSTAPMDPVAKPAAPKIDVTNLGKLEEIRKKLGYHSA